MVGKYISIEMVVEKSQETYYEVLQDSSIDWHENSNDYMPFIKYTLGTIIKAYKVHIPQELRIRSGGTERHSASN